VWGREGAAALQAAANGGTKDERRRWAWVTVQQDPAWSMGARCCGGGGEAEC